MERRFIKSFQGLRCIAAFMVFVSHSGGLLRIGRITLTGPGYGAFAVTIFFMLSGFLAQMKFDAKERQRATKKQLCAECGRSFLHALKAYLPLHLIMVAAAVILKLGSFASAPGRMTIALVLQVLLLQSWCPDRSIYCTFNDVSWYLSALLFLSAIAPLLVRGVRLLRGKLVIVLPIAIVMLQVGLAFAYEGLSAVTSGGEYSESFQASLGYWLVYIFPPARIADYVVGCALFRIFARCREKVSPACSVVLLAVFAAVGALALLLCIKSPNYRVFDDAVWLLPAAGLVFALACGDGRSKVIGAVLGNSVARFLGGITFEFFLMHTIALRCTRALYSRLVGEPGLLCAAAAFVITFAVAAAYHAVYVRIKRALASRKDKALN